MLVFVLGAAALCLFSGPLSRSDAVFYLLGAFAGAVMWLGVLLVFIMRFLNVGAATVSKHFFIQVRKRQ